MTDYTTERAAAQHQILRFSWVAGLGIEHVAAFLGMSVDAVNLEYTAFQDEVDQQRRIEEAYGDYRAALNAVN